MRLLATTTATALLASCSVLFMEQLPKGYTPDKGEPRCTTSTGWPLWDSLIVVTSGVGAALMFKAADAERDAGQRPGTTITYGVLMVVDGLLHLLSARDGFNAASQCERARRERDAFTRKPVRVPRPVVVDAGVDAVVIDAPIDAVPLIVDPEEPPAKGGN